MDDSVLWIPDHDRSAATQMAAFRRVCSESTGRDLTEAAAMHAWSVDSLDEFWPALWDFCGVRGERGDTAVLDSDALPGARFFPDARLNFAENLLRRGDGVAAMRFTGEDGETRSLTWADLRATVARTAAALRADGVEAGDRVAAWMPNVPETYVVMLACATIGAVFSSTSPDFGVQGVLDRFGQIRPTVLVAADSYTYGGKRHDCLDRLGDIVAGLDGLRRTVVVDGGGPALRSGWTSWEEWLAPHPDTEPEFVRLPFDHPLYILYSSGTTGAPKCIVHRAGGILLQHLKEHRLHCDVQPGDRVFYFTTAGWMMWNWLASALASEATLILYDGSPVAPTSAVLFDLAEREGVTLLGTSAKFIDACAKEGLSPVHTHDLHTLRTITSTGSPLAPEGFRYVYEHVSADVHLASISGGTDICGCFVGGDPTLPVRAGEIQGAALGMASDVFSADGTPLPVGETGELVCTRPFPSVPLGFWDDPGDARFRAAYFERFPGIWHHGDFVRRTVHDGWVILGRSDATLNPGGVRIGTAELYRQVERFEEVAESLAIGQEWDSDTRIVLFVRLAPDVTLTEDLRGRIRSRIRAECSPRHVPARIVAVADLPRTRSGKISELAVRDVVAGRAVTNTEALANPDSLDLFRNLSELAGGFGGRAGPATGEP